MEFVNEYNDINMFLRQWFLPIKMIGNIASLPIKSNFQKLFCALVV
jgi:hypothetical protein